jgi:hypothetical protein
MRCVRLDRFGAPHVQQFGDTLLLVIPETVPGPNMVFLETRVYALKGGGCKEVFASKDILASREGEFLIQPVFSLSLSAQGPVLLRTELRSPINDARNMSSTAVKAWVWDDDKQVFVVEER